MRIQAFVFALLLPTSFVIGMGAADYRTLDEFHTAKADWDRAVADYQKRPETPLSIAESKLEAMMAVWSKLPGEVQNARYDELNRTWYTMARLSAERGKYEQALNFLDTEMRYQYARHTSVFLSGQNHPFFEDVVKLEATVLGHLGRKHYLSTIDTYLMPVDVDRDGIDDFISIEAVDETEEKGITIPPLPKDEDRTIVRLLQANDKGNYSVRDTIQLIGKKGKELHVGIVEAQTPAILALGGVSHKVELKDGIPINYTPLAAPFIKFKVTKEGFEELP